MNLSRITSKLLEQPRKSSKDLRVGQYLHPSQSDDKSKDDLLNKLEQDKEEDCIIESEMLES